MAQAQLTQAGAPKLKVFLDDSSPRLVPMAETVTLSNLYEMPTIAFGTWQIPKPATYDRVRDALDAGYRHIDTSPGFRNETEAAKAITQWALDRKVERSTIFVTTKIWNTRHSFDSCTREIDRLLALFKFPFIDMLVMHWPMGWEEGSDELYPRNDRGDFAASDIDYLETWMAMVAKAKQGRIRSLGLANFNLKQVERLWNADDEIKPQVCQIECNPLFTQLEYRKYCEEKGIVIMCHAPLGNPGSMVYRRPGHPNLLMNETLLSIARGHGKTVVQVILRWVIDSNMTAAVKSNDPKRIRHNINIFKFKLTPEEITRIDRLNANFRFIDPILGNVDHPHYPWPVKDR